MTEWNAIEAAPRAPGSRVTAFVRAHPWAVVVYGSTVAWALLLCAIARTHFLELQHQRYDLGNMVQAVWSTTQGRPLEMTLGTGEQASRLASHVDPILALFAPLWIVFPTPLTLVYAQITACALGVLPVYWLGRRHLSSESAAALLALTYLTYPWLAWTALDAMHPVTLAIPLFLFAIWFLDSGKLWAFWICALLVLATGELMGLSLALLGVWYWLARGQRSAGLLIGAVGFLWSALCLKVVIPHYAGRDSGFYSYFEAVGGSPEGVLRNVFTDPGRVFGALGIGELVFVLLLGAPLLGAFLLAPGVALVAAPQLASNGLSSMAAATDPRQHYIAAAIPFLVAATVFGIAKLTPRAQQRAAATALVASVGISLAYGPWHALPGPRPPWLHAWTYVERPPGHAVALDEALSLIPDDAPVASTNKAGSHLAARRYLYGVPVLDGPNTRPAQWILIDLNDPWVPLPPHTKERVTWGRIDGRLLERFQQQIARESSWRQVYAGSGVFVYRRT